MLDWATGPHESSTLSEMTNNNAHKIPMGLVAFALLMGACTYFQRDMGPPEGTWACISEWSQEQNGVNEPRSVEQQVSCADNVLSTSGVISIGSAQWSEDKEGTCYASGDELSGTWTSVQTAPENDAARQFEQERLGGRSLAIATRPAEPDYRIRVTSRTDTEFTAVNSEGRVISCSRL